MRVTILGTGAMGCLFGARLAAHAEVILLGTWREAIAAIRARGIILHEPSRDQQSRVHATDRAEECLGSDLVLVLVKAWQTREAARRAVIALAPSGLALTLQNGLGNREELERIFGSDRTGLGVTTLSATLLAPGEIASGGEGSVSLAFHRRIEPVRKLFLQAGVEARVEEDIESLLWGKLVINAAINPLAALLHKRNGELLESPDARYLMQALAQEAARVAHAAGVALPYPDPIAQVEATALRSSSNHSSMLQDVERHRPTEIDAISGAVVAQADSLGLEAPLNRTMWRLVRALRS
ncbi:MAG: 2-dehydropantoate 2-reductase [Anaerolineales bacterium]